MAHIPALNVPEATPSGAPGNDYERIQTSPNMFGGFTARAEETLGQGLEKAGNAGLEFATQRQHINNELYANDAAVPGMKQLASEWGKFNTLEGRGAVDALPGFQTRAEEIYKSTLDQAPNIDAKRLLAPAMRRMTDEYLRAAQTYADHQQKSWVDKSSLDLAHEFYNQATLARNDPDQMERLLRSGDEKMRDLGTLRGLDQPTINRMMMQERSKALKQIIETVAIGVGGEVGNPARAAAMLEHYQAQMAASDILAVGKSLRSGLDDSRAIGIVDMLMGRVQREAPSGPPQLPNPSGPTQREAKFSPEVNSAIDNAARSTGVSAGLLRTVASIESGGSPSAQTGSYRGLFQLSNEEFQRHGGGNVFDANANALAAARKIKAESAQFEAVYGHPPDPWEVYMIHQQGWGGFNAHMANPNRPAWENMWSTAEGQQKGQNWAKRAIWGNIADRDKAAFGNVDNVTSAQFTQYWQAKVARFGGADPAAFGRMPVDVVHPDRSDLLGRAASFIRDNNIPPRIASKVLAGVNHEVSLYDSLNKTERDDLAKNLPDWISAAENGVPNLTIPEDRIRAVFPPVQAQRYIDEFNIANQVGTAMRGLQWATPQQIAEAQHDIESGTGVLSDMLRAHHKEATSGPGAVEGGPEPGEGQLAEQGMYFRLRRGAALQLERAIERRRQLLTGPDADPAAYVAKNPFVRNAALGGGMPDQPAGAAAASQFQTYASASLAVQDQLGVPEEERHVLTRGKALDMVRAINDGDPVKTFQQLQAQSGNAWPQVFKDLVTLGKLSPSYAAVGALSDPATLNSPQDATLLARWLKESPKDKDVSHLLGAQAVADIRDGVRGNTAIQQYESSLKKSGLSRPQIDAVRQSVEDLAFAYKYFDKSDKPLESAIAAFTGKMTFLPEGGARVPTNVYENVRTNTRGALNDLTLENVQAPGGSRDKEWLELVKASPTWVTQGDAVWLMDQGGRWVRDKAGNPIKVEFSTPPRSTPTPEIYEPTTGARLQFTPTGDSRDLDRRATSVLETEHTMSSTRKISDQLMRSGFRLPTESDLGSENIEDKRAPIYSRSSGKRP